MEGRQFNILSHPYPSSRSCQDVQNRTPFSLGHRKIFQHILSCLSLIHSAFPPLYLRILAAYGRILSRMTRKAMMTSSIQLRAARSTFSPVPITYATTRSSAREPSKLLSSLHSLYPPTPKLRVQTIGNEPLSLPCPFAIIMHDGALPSPPQTFEFMRMR